MYNLVNYFFSIIILIVIIIVWYKILENYSENIIPTTILIESGASKKMLDDELKKISLTINKEITKNTESYVLSVNRITESTYIFQENKIIKEIDDFFYKLKDDFDKKDIIEFQSLVEEYLTSSINAYISGYTTKITELNSNIRKYLSENFVENDFISTIFSSLSQIFENIETNLINLYGFHSNEIKNDNILSKRIDSDYQNYITQEYKKNDYLYDYDQYNNQIIAKYDDIIDKLQKLYVSSLYVTSELSNLNNFIKNQELILQQNINLYSTKSNVKYYTTLMNTLNFLEKRFDIDVQPQEDNKDKNFLRNEFKFFILNEIEKLGLFTTRTLYFFRNKFDSYIQQMKTYSNLLTVDGTGEFQRNKLNEITVLQKAFEELWNLYVLNSVFQPKKDIIENIYNNNNNLLEGLLEQNIQLINQEISRLKTQTEGEINLTTSRYEMLKKKLSELYSDLQFYKDKETFINNKYSSYNFNEGNNLQQYLNVINDQVTNEKSLLNTKINELEQKTQQYFIGEQKTFDIENKNTNFVNSINNKMKDTGILYTNELLDNEIRKKEDDDIYYYIDDVKYKLDEKNNYFYTNNTFNDTKKNEINKIIKEQSDTTSYNYAETKYNDLIKDNSNVMIFPKIAQGYDKINELNDKGIISSNEITTIKNSLTGYHKDFANIYYTTQKNNFNGTGINDIKETVKKTTIPDEISSNNTTFLNNNLLNVTTSPSGSVYKIFNNYKTNINSYINEFQKL